MTLTLSGQLSHAVRLASKVLWRSETPKVLLLLVWPFPLSLATTSGISFDFSSSPYLDVSVQGVPHAYLLIQYTFHDSSSWVFPHSEICGSKLICSSPQLIAACHVLRRLPMPRHSPYALLRLNYLMFWSIGLNITVLSSLSLELLCVSYFAVTWSRLIFSFRPWQNCLFYPLVWRKNLISNFYRFLCFFPLLLSVMYVTLILFRINMFVSYSVFNELQLNFH